MCSRQRANGQRRLTIEEVRRKLKRINPAIEVIRVYHGDNSLIPNSEVGQAHLRRNEKHRRSRLWVKCRCRQCNHIWSPSWDSLCHNKSGCPQCGALKSEEEVRSTLEKLTGLKWPRANPTDAPFLHGLTLDGYCRELRSPKFPNGTAFERQGEQHYYLCRWNRWDSKKLLQQKRRDKRKRMQCWRHGVRLIRIPYWVKDVGGYLKQKLVKGQVRSPR